MKTPTIRHAGETKPPVNPSRALVEGSLDDVTDRELRRATALTVLPEGTQSERAADDGRQQRANLIQRG
jgi:hypothetical protein